MKNVKEIETRMRMYHILTEGIKKHREKTEDPSCDKHCLGFNVDDRFSSAKVMVRVESKRGYYGDSGVSKSLPDLDDKIFAKHFLKVLNSKFDELMDLTGKSIHKEASDFVDEARKELESKMESVNNAVSPTINQV